MSTSTNYDMSRSSSDAYELSSIYIPRVYANITTDFIAETFESLNLGIVDRVEAVPRPGDKTSYMAFVYFASWNMENKAAVHLAERIKCPTPGASQARIVYDDPWYWILLPNKSENTSSSSNKTDEELFLEEFNRSSGICAQEWELRQKWEKEQQAKLNEDAEIYDALKQQELETDEKIDILYDMIEDLQVRLKVSEDNNERLKKELYDVRTILLTGEPVNSFEDETIPTPPKLVRQTASCYFDMPPSSPPKLVRQNATICEIDELDALESGGFVDDVPPPPPRMLQRQTQVSVDPNDFVPHDPEEFAARMSAEIAEFQKMKREWEEKNGQSWMNRTESSNFYKVDDLGLVYREPPTDDKNFWCDP